MLSSFSDLISLYGCGFGGEIQRNRKFLRPKKNKQTVDKTKTPDNKGKKTVF